MTVADPSARAVVVGAGIGGLATALVLSRRGHRVVVLERDDTPLPAHPELAFEWDRRGAPQVRHSHVFTARITNLFRDQYPDVRQALLEAGAELHNTLSFGLDYQGTVEPGDEDLDVLACRRTTFEWVLRRAALASPDVELRTGVAVDGLVGELGDAGRPPTITGVRLADGETVDGDLVVATTGRRGDVATWLAPFGVEIPETTDDVGTVYFSRFYRLADGNELPPGLVAGIRAGIGYAVFAGDNRTFSRTLVVPSDDNELRAHLRGSTRYEAVCQLLPEIAAISTPEFAEPISPVQVMGGLINRIRRFADRNGDPRVLGFHAVGDAHTTTNPAYGRGCSLAFVQAQLLAEALDQHPGDAWARAVAYEAASASEVEPWYHFSLLSDAAARVERERTRDGAPAGGSDNGVVNPFDPAVFFEARRDPVLARAFAQLLSLLRTPDSFLTDPDILQRVAAIALKSREGSGRSGPVADRRRRPRVTREDLLNAA